MYYSTYKYKGCTIEIAEDRRSYRVIEMTPVLKHKAVVLFGASADPEFTLEYVRKEIDEHIHNNP